MADTDPAGELREAAWGSDAPEVVHLLPVAGFSIGYPPVTDETFACCGKTPSEVPSSHRMTSEPLRVTCGNPPAGSAHRFLLGDAWLIVTCPGCFDEVSVVDGHVFLAGSDEGMPIDGPATLGALVDAANAHVCGAGDD